MAVSLTKTRILSLILEEQLTIIQYEYTFPRL